MSADLSVVICSLNGAAGVDRCLRALAEQKDVELQIIVVDDGSTDNMSEVAREHGVTVLRHEVNRGASAARNTGMWAATAPVVAFLDDDCEPEREWARGLIGSYDNGVIGVGGPLVPNTLEGFMLGFLRRNNPLLPLEMNLARSEKLLYRLYLYLLRQWAPYERNDKRDVYTLVGANMSFLRAALAETGGLDERFQFGSEDLDCCFQLRRRLPEGRLVVTPDAVVRHHFKNSLRDTLRRSRAYGRGSAMLYLKWPTTRPTIFPGPVLICALIVASVFAPFLLVVTVLLPQLIYPKGLRRAVTRWQPACLLDPYVQLAQEVCWTVGYIQGLWRNWGFVPEADASVTTRRSKEKTAAGSVT
jgi:glycosyltransferase involved in cell wall biosynthesis